MSARRSTRKIVDERVLLIEGLMRRAAWDRGRSNRVLAQQWGCTVSAVNDYAAEAARRVRAEVTDPEMVETTVCAALSTVVRDGMRDSDRRSVIRAADVWSRIVGARAPEARVEVPLTEEQALARYKELTGHAYKPKGEGE